MEATVPAAVRSGSLSWSARLQPALSWLYGLALVALVAGDAGGFRATTWAWTAMVTWWLAVLALIVKRRVALGVLDLLLVTGTLAFAGWFALSATWSRSAPSTLDEVIRYVAYAGIVTAALLLVERRTTVHFVGGVTSAIALLTLYALGTRVLPDRLGEFDSVEAQYRLAAPITYWNGLGIFCVIGLLLAGGFAARSTHLVTRALAGATLPIFAAAMTFTFSRGAWLALPVGLVTAFAVDPRRLQLALATLVLGITPGFAVLLAAHTDALTVQSSTLDAAVREGHRFAVWLALLCVLSAVLALSLGVTGRIIKVPRAVRLAWMGTLAGAVVVGFAAVWMTAGSPVQLAREAWDEASTGVQVTGPANNTERLFNLSANGRFELWRVGWDAFRDSSLSGTGGGTFGQLWAESPRQSFSTVEAHSVYVETLAELGVVGLGLLLVVLVPPLVAAVRVRRTPLMPFALAAYAAWLAHSGVDWDWELVGVSGAGLLCGVALVASARGDGRALSPWLRGGAAVAASVVALLALTSAIANTRIDNANGALVDGKPDQAVAYARDARRFAPWSVDALEALAAARQAQGRDADALDTHRDMVARDPRNWIAWAALAEIATGDERQRAVEHVRQLNTRGPQL